MRRRCSLHRRGVSNLDDLIEANHALLECGADIVETNTVRKHLSAIKGGRLAAAAGRARLITLVLSDVVGDPLDVIASGPTVPDPTTYGDALGDVERHGIFDRLSGRVLGHLERGRRGLVEETPKQPHLRHEIVVIGSGAVAAEAAATFLHSRGVPARIVSTRHMGEAREAAVAALSTESHGDEVLIFAGETTVTVRGSGRGGRNQEAALAAALEVDGQPVTFLAGGTDGIDGPTDAAGGIVDGGTIGRGLLRTSIRSRRLPTTTPIRSLPRPATSSSSVRPGPTWRISGCSDAELSAEPMDSGISRRAIVAAAV